MPVRGRVLPVGGLKEKSVAALRHGVRRMILPAANLPDLELLPDEVRSGLEFVAVKSMDDVLEAALVSLPTERLAERSPETTLPADPGMQVSQ
jgi:ATP-dependent Lon protease